MGCKSRTECDGRESGKVMMIDVGALSKAIFVQAALMIVAVS